jgi:HAD superfamily hydrolase (TIGR01509 family)
MKPTPSRAGSGTQPQTTPRGDLALARVWLFDFDNTLVALEPEVDWAASRLELERYLRQAGVGEAIFREVPKGNLPLYEKLRRRLMEHAGEDAAGGADGALRGVSSATLLAGVSELIEAYELRGAERAQPLSGAISLLHAVRARSRPIAIVSSNSSRTVGRWLERHGLNAMVDCIVGRDSLLPLKPAPDMLVRALTLTSAAVAEAVFVGDSAADAGAAQAAGVAFYGIAATVERRERLRLDGARGIFGAPADLAERLISAP